LGVDRAGRGTQATLLVAEVVPLVPAWGVDRTFSYSIPPGVEVTAGALVRIPFGSRTIRGVVVRLNETDTEPERAIASKVIDVAVADAALIETLYWIAERHTTPLGAVFGRVVPPRVKVTPRVPARPERQPLARIGVPGTELLDDAVASGTEGVFCLETMGNYADEVARIVSALGQGQAIVCVPEVKWGSEVLDRMEELGGLRLDSAVTPARRSEALVSMASGAFLGAGGRAAVLAPAPDLRLLILIDEGNIALKEDRSPRFDAREVALHRCAASQAVCVLLGRTHRLESVHLAEQQRAVMVRPERDLARRSLPIIELCEPDDDGYSKRTRAAIASVLGSKGRVGILTPQPGYARSLWCATCKRSVRCPRCEAGVSYEKASRSARCPRCSFTARAPDVCPNCSSIELKYLGAGSERLEEQLGKIFPRARVTRMDRQTLDDLAAVPDHDDADIYVTTWIGTKQVLRPDVDLVVVLDADRMIRRPELRAAEDAFQALNEMAAWAGPASLGGRLVIQTREPTHPALQALVRADTSFFYERELELRRDLDYPPFTQLIKVQANGPAARAIFDRVKAVAEESGVAALGPVEISRGDSSVEEMLLKCPEAQEIARELRVILPDVPKGSTLRIDVDPR
jgi:primosomal protein N' (replication factor Y) (superfamily II helicase)